MRAGKNTRVFNVGEIYLVRFHPSAGAELKRYRPAVVVSSEVHVIDPRFVLIAPLTSSGIMHSAYEMAVKRRGNLDKNSTLLVWYLRTVDVSRIQEKIAVMNQREVRTLKSMLKKLFSL